MARTKTDSHTQAIYMMGYAYDGRIQFFPLISVKRVYDATKDKVSYRNTTPKFCNVSYLAFTIDEAHIQDYLPGFAYQPGNIAYINGEVEYRVFDDPLITCNPLAAWNEPLLWKKEIVAIRILREYPSLAMLKQVYGEVENDV